MLQTPLSTHCVCVFTLIIVIITFCEAAEPHVFITIEAKASVNLRGKITENQITLNWDCATPEVNDWVGLFTQDPTTNFSQPIFNTLVTSKEGTQNTNESMPIPNTDLPLEKQCLGFWIAYIRNQTVLTSNCFQTQPFWMWENRKLFGKMSLSQMMIPGTHDSGSFQTFKGLASENILTDHVIAQIFDFWDQLVLGIRHFDIRVGYNKKTNSFWLIHGRYQTSNSLDKQLESIKKFVTSTHEIVILDFHGFARGFKLSHGKDNYKLHDSLISLLTQELEPLLIPRSFGYNATLSKLWKTNKRILLCYNFDSYFNTNPNLWPGVYQAWADSVNLTDIVEYFNNILAQSVNYSIWSLQAAATPELKNWIKEPTDGLREEGDKFNPIVSKYVRDYWWDGANIIATDFFEGTDMVELSIESNKRKAKSMSTH